MRLETLVDAARATEKLQSRRGHGPAHGATSVVRRREAQRCAAFDDATVAPTASIHKASVFKAELDDIHRTGPRDPRLGDSAREERHDGIRHVARFKYKDLGRDLIFLKHNNLAEVDEVLYPLAVEDINNTALLVPELRSSRVAQTNRLRDTRRRHVACQLHVFFDAHPIRVDRRPHEVASSRRYPPA